MKWLLCFIRASKFGLITFHGMKYTLIIGLTPTGRATVEALQLNHSALQNLRTVLYLVGQHPPE